MNPFDDNAHGGTMMLAANPTNPFDDDPTNLNATFSDRAEDEAGLLLSGHDDDDRMLRSTNSSLIPPSAASPEATWQYLGDLPYRRVPIYSNVQWKRMPTAADATAAQHSATASDTALWQHGLASFSPHAAKHHPKLLEPREVRALLKTSTVTHVKGCPHGGPLAVVTLPVVSAATVSSSSSSATMADSSRFPRAELRILTNAGHPLAQFDLPPPGLEHRYGAADVLSLGFTSRTTLVVVFRDSLCLTYNLRGQPLLPPFFILPRRNAGTQLVQAAVYDGGVAVLAHDMNSALVELLDDHDEVEYLQTAHVTARKVTAKSNHHMSSSTAGAATATTGDSLLVDESTASSSSTTFFPIVSSHYALVTFLPTAEHFNQRDKINKNNKFGNYLTLGVLSRTRTNSKHPEVFLSTSDNSVVIIDAATLHMTDVDCRNRLAAPIVDMVFSPNGRFLACYCYLESFKSSMLSVVSTSFETKVLDFDTSEGSSSPPCEMQWCGEDSVVLHWKNLGVLMVGPYGDWLRFPYEETENLYIIPEMDCCRVIGDTFVEILQRVPPDTATLLRIGSIETAAMLVDASDAFHAGSPTSDETARAILQAGHLEQAIQVCTDAATKEFDIMTQKRLLRAASYGMHFSYKTPEDAANSTIMGGPTWMGTSAGVEDLSPSSRLRPSPMAVAFVEASRKLRILNSLRNPKVGFLATCAQFDAMTPTGVVARLIAMKRPSLACSISSYLSLPKSVQLFARASKAAALVETDTHRSDSEVAEAAVRIINGDDSYRNSSNNTTDGSGAAVDDGMAESGSSSHLYHSNAAANSIHRGGYATVAMAANQAGRTGVANLLLMLESSVADKVPALISTGSYADAMAVATSARDADFIFYTLMEYERAVSAEDVSKAQSTFLGTVVSKFTPEGFHTLRRYLQTTPDVKSVTNLLLRAQRFSSAGAAIAQRALEETDLREKQGMLAEASRIFGLGKETAFHKSSTDDYLELLRDQELLRTKYGAQEVAPESSSVTGTIASVIAFASTNVREQHRLLSDAEKLGKKYRVPERRYWHIKVNAFADSGQWSNLRILAESKTKSPIGFKPFARAAIRGKQSSAEILKYIDRVVVQEERYDLLCEAHLWKKALEEAGRMRDTRRVANVKSLCNSSEIQLMADEMMGRLA